MFHALVIAASVHSKQGTFLWRNQFKGHKRLKTLAPHVDFGEYMKEWRFKEIKHLIPQIMSRKGGNDDDWSTVRRKMDLFHQNIDKCMYVSSVCAFDESMSAFVPRTTKTGGLPNLSYIARKPEPLGTEFKCICDGLTGKLIWLEVQEGKERMREKKYKEHGTTTACTLRGIERCRRYDAVPVEGIDANDYEEADLIDSNKKRLWIGDSWFGSVKTAENIAKMGQHTGK